MPYACTSYTPQLLHAFAIIYLFMIGNGGNMEVTKKAELFQEIFITFNNDYPAHDNNN